MSVEDHIKLSVRYRVDFAMTGTSPLAELLFIRSLAYCGLNGTHGNVPAADLPTIATGLRRPTTLAAELVTGGYWHTMPTGWGVRQWDKWQAEFDAIEAKRLRDKERQRAHRQARREAKEAEANA